MGTVITSLDMPLALITFLLESSAKQKVDNNDPWKHVWKRTIYVWTPQPGGKQYQLVMNC